MLKLLFLSEAMQTPKPNAKAAALQRVRTLTHLLDNAITVPGTSYRIGIDPLLGLFPGAGDIAGSVLSAYIILEAARFGLPRETLVRMLLNLASDSVLGSLPIVGDLFDATWKANSRNLALLEAHVDAPQTRKPANRMFVALILLGLLLIVVGAATVAVLLVNLLFRAISGS